MTVFIQKGDLPLTYRQAVKRGLRYFESEKLSYEREQGIVESDPDYLEWANQWIADNEINALNNKFNAELYAYRSALARLEKYVVSVGQEEITEEIGTGTFDEQGNEIFETVIVQPAIAPLDPTVEITIYDEETGESTIQTIPNPDIVRDEEERNTAQLIVDSTSQEVKDFNNA